VVISEKRTSATDAQFFRSLGIEPADKQILAIKSVHHFRASYEPIVKKIIDVHCPNDYSPCGNFAHGTRYGRIWPYKNVPRPIWPLDDYKEE
jgi:microcystin degradation protein MlrC